MSGSDDHPSQEEPAFDDWIPCGVLRTSDNGTISRVNRTFCQWLGQSEDALIGRRFQELLTMGGRIFHQTHWAPLLTMQGSISEVKLDLLHADGSSIPMVLNAIRRETTGGVIVHDLAAFVARDRDRYERELVAARKRVENLHAEAKDRALFAEQMIGIVSHDLRNPLSSILMAAGLLTRDVSPSQDRVLAKITRATNRANALIGDLLDFTQARLGAGLPVSLAPLDVHAVVADAVEELAFSHPERTLEHVRVREGECSADLNRLSQFIGNLVSNAVAYGAVDVPITITSTIDDTTFSIAVHNGGAPIAPSILETLFLPMTRGTKSSSTVRSVGLGLFIVREITRAHGGTANVTSTTSEGTTFTGIFPRHPKD